MRTMFTSGFQSPAQSFWMGAQAPLPEGTYGVDYNGLRNNLNTAEKLYDAVADWLSKTTNPRDALGGGADADVFQQWGTQIVNVYDTETRINQMLNSGNDVKISQDEYADLQAFMQLANSMYAMVQKYGGFGGAPAPVARPAGTLPTAPPIVPAAQAKPGTPPAPGAKAPTAAIAPKADSTPYYVAGGLAAGGIILALVLRK